MEAQVGVSPPGTLDSSESRTGPIKFTAARRDLNGVGSRAPRPVLGQENWLSPPFASLQPKEDRRLRGLGRAERVNLPLPIPPDRMCGEGR